MEQQIIEAIRRASSSLESSSYHLATPIDLDTTPRAQQRSSQDPLDPSPSTPFLYALPCLTPNELVRHGLYIRRGAEQEPVRKQERERGRNYGRTRSWAEEVQQHHGEFQGAEAGDESEMEGGEREEKDKFKTPTPDNGASWEWVDEADTVPARPVSPRPEADGPIPRRLEYESRSPSAAPSASTSRSASHTTLSGLTDELTDEELLSLSSAEFGRRMIATERAQRKARRERYLKRQEEKEQRRKAREERERNRPAPLLLQPANMQYGCAGRVKRITPTTATAPEVKPRPAALDNIISIGDIVNKHKGAIEDAQAAARDKAKKEMGMQVKPKPKPKPKSTTPTASPPPTTQRKKGETPPIPVRTSSSPDVKVGVVPPRTSSRVNLHSPSASLSRTASQSTTTGTESVTRNAMLNQAALERLEQGSIPSSPSDRKVSFQADERQTPTRPRNERASTTPFRSPGRKSNGTPSIKEEDEEQQHAVAVYLRSPNLNRYISFPKPFGEQAFRVSVAEVGSPTGAPVLLFLGLGCVRYLIALFDELAKALDLRLICIDRWGYGKTDPVEEEKRGLREWAAVVERVLDEMKIDTFSVLAHSAGCPYAMAAANRMKERVYGPLHLLAPWVGSDAENNYKWLKWVPNGVIKSATAAEWKLQSYFIGKPPPLVMKPIGYTYTPPVSASSLHLPVGLGGNQSRSSLGGLGRKPSLLHRASSIMLRSKSAEPEASSTDLSRSNTGRSAKTANGRLAIPSLGSSVSLHKPSATSPRALDFGLSEGFDLKAPAQQVGTSQKSGNSSPKKSRLSTYSYSYSYSYSRSPASKAKPKTDRSNQTASPSPPSGPSFGTALQQASHAECEPGTTADLLSIVLNREQTRRPWQYALNYAEYRLPVKVYWGDQDDKISEKSVRWLERTMTSGCELRVLPGEGHNLMTSSGTMLDVFQSLAAEIEAARKAEALRLYELSQP